MMIRQTEARLRSRCPELLALALIASPAFAATWFDPDLQALPCRPTVACTADLVPPGAFELELGYLYKQLGGGAHQHSIPMLAKLTLAEWVQLQVGGNGPIFANLPTPTHYLDDLIVGFKFHLFDQTRRIPSLSWSAEASIPLAAATGYVRTTDLLLNAYVTKDFRWLHADLNLGLNLLSLDAPSPRPQPWMALAFSVALPKGFTVMAEHYFFLDFAPVAAEDGGLLLALAWAAKRWIVFDVGGDVGYLQSKRSYSLFVGTTITPVDFWASALEKRRLPHER
jgi:hypothetical protein